MADEDTEREIARIVRDLQARLVASGRPAFDDDAVIHLKTLIRSSVEFSIAIADAPWPPTRRDDLLALRRTTESILIHAESFENVLSIYSVLVGSHISSVRWDELRVRDIPVLCDTLFRDLRRDDQTFVYQCRRLIDLARLQCICAGLYHDAW